MCNIAGYIGIKQAMPILIEMMSNEEGWDSGFYTGYAVIGQDKLYTDKVVGDLGTLLRTTDASSIPGTVGIMHSRTPGKPAEGPQYAHPFIGDGDRHAYVYNCASGFFENTPNDFRFSAFHSLKASGYRFDSELPEPSKAFGDTRIGVCELLSHLNSIDIRNGMDAVDAMEKNNGKIPMELACLAVSLDEPDCILYSKTTFPMFLGIAPHGTYLASTPQAFPADTTRVLCLDSMTGGRVYRDRHTVKAYKTPPAPPAVITASLWKQAYELCVEMIRTQPRMYPELKFALRDIVKAQQPGTVPVDAPVIYRILYELEKAGRIRREAGTVPGQLPGTTAPKFYAHWVK